MKILCANLRLHYFIADAKGIPNFYIVLHLAGQRAHFHITLDSSLIYRYGFDLEDTPGQSIFLRKQN